MTGSQSTPSRARGPLRVLLLIGGALSLALGAAGVVVPVLPTTPFLILAVFCFARSSQRIHDWLVSNRLFGPFIRDYFSGQGLSLKTVLPTLAVLWVALGLTAFLVFDSEVVRFLLLAIAGGVTLHLLAMGRGPSQTGGAVAGLWLSRAVSGFAYLLALALAVGVVHVSGAEHPLAQLGLGTLTATLVIFGASVLADNSSLYDPYWSLQPAAIAVYYLLRLEGRPDARTLVVAALVFLYALRLTSNFYRDWPGLAHEDFRYREFRARFGRWYWPVSLFGIHLFPTLMVYLGCLPLYAVMGRGTRPLMWLDAVAFLVTLGAIVLAFVADEQLRRFRRQIDNRGMSIGTGLWLYTRHPNYLGEMGTWWGLFLFGLAADPQMWWTGVGAAAITLMFVFVSVPMMERRALVTRRGYGEYRSATPMLLPRPWRAPSPVPAQGVGEEPEHAEEGSS